MGAHSGCRRAGECPRPAEFVSFGLRLSREWAGRGGCGAGARCTEQETEARARRAPGFGSGRAARSQPRRTSESSCSSSKAQGLPAKAGNSPPPPPARPAIAIASSLPRGRASPVGTPRPLPERFPTTPEPRQAWIFPLRHVLLVEVGALLGELCQARVPRGGGPQGFRSTGQSVGKGGFKVSLPRHVE